MSSAKPAGASKARSRVLAFVKLAVAAGLLTFIFCRVDVRELMRQLARMDWWYFVLAVALQWVVVAIGTHRLQILLRAQNVHLSFLRTLKYNCIGYFFNLFSLGATGGDVVKSFYVARETERHKTESVTVVFLDRIMGMASVLIIAACVILATLWKDDTFRPLLPAVLLILVMGLAGVCIVFTKNWWTRFISFDHLLKTGACLLAAGCLALTALRLTGALNFRWSVVAVAVAACLTGSGIILSRNYWKRVALLHRISESVGRTLRRIVNALHEYRAHRWAAITALAESIALQLIMCVIAWCFGRGLGFEVRWYAYFIVFPIATLILALPISPGGLGTGDLALIEGFKRFGVSDDLGAAFAVLLRLVMLSMSLVGFVLWILPGTHVARKELVARAEELDG